MHTVLARRNVLEFSLASDDGIDRTTGASFCSSSGACSSGAAQYSHDRCRRCVGFGLPAGTNWQRCASAAVRSASGWSCRGLACLLMPVFEQCNQTLATTTWDTTNQRPPLPNLTPQTRTAKPRLTTRQVSCRHPLLTSSHLRGRSWRCTMCSHCAHRRVRLP